MARSSDALWLWLGAVALASCGGTHAPEPTPGAHASSAEESGGTSPEVTGDPKLVELRAAARRRVAADRAVASNAFGYEQAVARHERTRLDTGMAAHIPRDFDAEAVTRKLGALAEEHGVLMSRLDLGAQLPSRPVPAVYRGDRPFDYREDQLFDEVPFTWTLGGVSDAGLVRFYRAVQGAGLPLPVVRRVVRGQGEVTLDGVFFVEREIAPPRHEVAVMTVATIATSAGVTLDEETRGAAEEAVAPLIAEHEALRGELQGAVDALGASHLASRRFELYRALIERVGRDPFPSPGVPDDGDARP